MYARLGDGGLSSALESTPFPLMSQIFQKAPLRDYEAFQLKAFLYRKSRDGTAPTSRLDTAARSAPLRHR